ncbi:hypothetical protein C4580_05705 [Candidatus Woesearchaeota archaeon]|nr:MAG: hypothetical protein C4580_05705 [Candidatus Woesearchaeota archaeon]
MKTTAIALALLIALVPALAWDSGGWFGDSWDSGGSFDDSFDSGGSFDDGFSDWGSDWSGGTDTWTDDFTDWGPNPPGQDWNPDPIQPINDWNPPTQPPVPPPNQAPALAAIGNKIVVEGSQLLFTVSATDPEGQTLAFTASNLPSGALFSGQTFSWTPDFNQAGTYTVTFTVTDPQGASDFETITIQVLDFVPPTPVNNPPVILSTPDTDAFVGEDYQSLVIAFDPDGNALSFSVNGPLGMTISSAQHGTYVFGAFVEEDETVQSTAITGQTFTVTVDDVDEDACGVIINGQSAYLQSNVWTTMNLNGFNLWVRATSYPSFGDCYVSIWDPRVAFAWLSFTPSPSQVGQNPVTITVTDGAASAQQSFLLNVTIDPRVFVVRPEEQKQPRADVHVNTIAIQDFATAGEMVLVTLNFENSGDIKLEDVKAQISIPELGIRSPRVGPFDLRTGKNVGRTLALEIPEDAAPGNYAVRVTIDSGAVHRIVHRDIEILE